MAQYIEVQSGLIDHPKTKRMARALGIPPVYVVGHLVAFWTWCMDYAPNGDLSKLDPTDIATDGARWPGDPDVFVSAMKDCGVGSGAGFLEVTAAGTLIVHDWYLYGGKILITRFYDTFRKRYARVPTDAEIFAAGLFPRGMQAPPTQPLPGEKNRSSVDQNASSTHADSFQRKTSDSDVEQSRAEERSVEQSRAEQSRGADSPTQVRNVIAESLVSAASRSASPASSPNGSLPASARSPTAAEVPRFPDRECPDRVSSPQPYVEFWLIRRPWWKSEMDKRVEKARQKRGGIQHLWPLRATIVADWVSDPATAPPEPKPPPPRPVSRPDPPPLTPEEEVEAAERSRQARANLLGKVRQKSEADAVTSAAPLGATQ